MNKNRKSDQTKLFDIEGFFKISVFEVSRVDSIYSRLKNVRKRNSKVKYL